MKVAIVHDWITTIGGAEKVVLTLHEMFPDAPIYTTVYNKKKLQKHFKDADIRTSIMQKIPFAKKYYRLFFPFMPIIFEQFDLSEYDLVISSSSCCSKGVITKTKTRHICYCHTPTRYVWEMYQEYNNKGKIKKFLIANIFHKIRMWDQLAAQRPDTMIASSQNVKKRIKKYYRRESEVINPPVEVEEFLNKENQENGDYYLVVARLIPIYKKIELIIKAFNELGLKLIIVGDGPELHKLKKIAKENIKFKGALHGEEKIKYYLNCKAFINMSEEDFGIAMVEAQAAGKPVIAYKKGGASEIITENKTGYFVEKQNAEELKKQVLRFEKTYKQFNSSEIRENAKRFSKENFKSEIKKIIQENN